MRIKSPVAPPTANAIAGAKLASDSTTAAGADPTSVGLPPTRRLPVLVTFHARTSPVEDTHSTFPDNVTHDPAAIEIRSMKPAVVPMVVIGSLDIWYAMVKLT